jgi:hypothetical protein
MTWLALGYGDLLTQAEVESFRIQMGISLIRNSLIPLQVATRNVDISHNNPIRGSQHHNPVSSTWHTQSGMFKSPTQFSQVTSKHKIINDSTRTTEVNLELPLLSPAKFSTPTTDSTNEFVEMAQVSDFIQLSGSSMHSPECQVVGVLRSALSNKPGDNRRAGRNIPGGKVEFAELVESAEFGQLSQSSSTNPSSPIISASVLKAAKKAASDMKATTRGSVELLNSALVRLLNWFLENGESSMCMKYR